MMVLGLAWAAPVDAEAVRDAMAEHWAVAEAIRRAAMSGDRAEAAAQARLLTIQPAEDAPAVVQDAVERLARLAEGIIRAEEPEALALAVARLGAACGGCHRERGVRHAFLPPDPKVHGGGEGWMWAGLTTADDGLFRQGASRFTVTDPPHGLRSALNRAREVAGDGRVNAYAEVLGTCPACHASAEPPEGLTAVMHERLALLDAARGAIARDDRAGWMDAALALAAIEDPYAGGPWSGWLVRLQRLAWRLASASTSAEAAVELGRVAQYCGACHRTVDAGPAGPRRDALEDWSADMLLWMGLVSGDTRVWNLGAERLGDPALKDLEGSRRPAAYGRVLVQR